MPNTRSGLQVAINELLPVNAFLWTAVEFANLKSCGGESLRWVASAIRPDFPRDKNFEPKIHPFCKERCSEDHLYIKRLVAGAAGDIKITRSDLEKLGDYLDHHKIVLNLSFSRNGLDAEIDMLNSEPGLFWFLRLGAASVFKHLGGPNSGAVKRCANFSGPRVDTRYCGNYFVTITVPGQRGRTLTEYCSQTCRNRVNTRNGARTKRRAARIEHEQAYERHVDIKKI